MTQSERKEGSADREHQFLKTAEVAQLLHVSPKTIARWSVEKRLPHTITPGGHRRFPASARAAGRGMSVSPLNGMISRTD